MTYRYWPENWPQFSALLDTVLELPTEQRLSWIDSLATESPAIKARLREFLTTTIGVDEILHKPPNFSAALLEETQYFQQIQIELQPDRLIGVYRLIRELGQGGMGMVWLAQRVDGKFQRDVALKFPYAGPHQRQLVERLTRERKILGSLQHANIARLYDADVTASGQPFLVLEYIDGIAINDYCDQHRLDIRARLLLFQQVLSAVRYAHAHLVIHRDLKPSNILITDDGVAHLLDFGIATSITDGMAHKTPLTQFGGHMLTPEYSSPEQVAGTTLTTASDIYSLGVVLYQLLTGILPYHWQREQRTQLEHTIINADAAVPSRADINEQVASNRNSSVRQLRKIFTGDLDTLVLKTLKKIPNDRYASIDAFQDDVDRYVHQQPILAQPDSQWYRVKKFIARNRLIVASTVAIALTLIIGSGVALWQAHEASLQRDRAVASAARSEAVTDFMQLMMTEVADGNEPITMQQLITRSEDIAAKSYLGGADQHAAILGLLGNYYLSFDHADDANRALTKALEISAHNSDKVLRAKLLCSSALADYELNKTQLARQQMEAGLAIAADAHDVQAMCLQVRAFLKYQDANLEGMLQDIQLAQQQLQRSGVSKPELTANLLADAALAYSDLGRTNDAEHQYVKAMELLSQFGRGETVLAMQLQNDWAVAHDSNGDPLGALKHYDKAMEIARKRGMGVHYEGMYAANRAYALHQLARDEEALAGYRQSIAAEQRNGDMLELISAKQRMAGVLITLGRTEEAQRVMSEMALVTNKELSNDSLTTQGTFSLHGLLAMQQHNYDEAIQSFSTNIDYLTAHNMRGGYLSTRYTWRGEAYLADKNSAAALADATQAYAIARSIQADFPYSVLTGNAALLLAKIHHVQNEESEVYKWATIAVTQLQSSVGAEHPATLEAKRLLNGMQTIH